MFTRMFNFDNSKLVPNYTKVNAKKRTKTTADYET